MSTTNSAPMTWVSTSSSEPETPGVRPTTVLAPKLANSSLIRKPAKLDPQTSVRHVASKVPIDVSIDHTPSVAAPTDALESGWPLSSSVSPSSSAYAPSADSTAAVGWAGSAVVSPPPAAAAAIASCRASAASTESTETGALSRKNRKKIASATTTKPTTPLPTMSFVRFPTR